MRAVVEQAMMLGRVEERPANEARDGDLLLRLGHDERAHHPGKRETAQPALSRDESGNHQGACAAVCARVKGRENWGGRGCCSYLDSLTVAGPADAAAASVRRAPPAALRPSLASIVRECKFRENLPLG